MPPATRLLPERAGLAKEFGSNAGVSALVGPAHDIQTVAGFTVWKCLAVLAVVGAVWGLLTGTRLLRGEEDAGRWELLLAGQTTRRAAAAQALAGLGCGLVALWAVTAVITVVVGRSSKVDISPAGALFLAVAVVAAAAMFLALGALASQLAPTRRQASTYASAVLGASYALRMVADSGTGLGWLRWASPLGWVEELQPLTSPHPLALLPIGGLVAVLALSRCVLQERAILARVPSPIVHARLRTPGSCSACWAWTFAWPGRAWRDGVGASPRTDSCSGSWRSLRGAR